MDNNTCTYDDLLLPHDVLIQILVCLPAISLLRFKSVCKSWHELIDSSFFIHLHAAAVTINTNLHSSRSSKFGTFIFQTLNPAEILMLSAASRSHSGGGGGGDTDNDDKDEVACEVKSLGFPPHYEVIIQMRERFGKEILMVGSCNGLICLHDKKIRDVSLWNPATRQFRILPKSLTFDEEGIGDFIEDFVGFGFDIKTKDYKVVHITWFKFKPCNNACEEYASRVQVYSLSTDSWRLLEGINYFPIPFQGAYMNHGLYLNGSYFFLGLDNDSRVESSVFCILSFDFTKEIFTAMQFPDQHRYYCMFLLTYLGEKIAFFGSVRLGNFDYFVEDYDIWVLNEHDGVKESWTKLHSDIGRNMNLRVDQLGSISKRYIPRGISNNGEFAIIESRDVGARKLVLFNLVTKEVKNEFPTGNQKVLRADVYKQSLVSVVGGNGRSSSSRPPLIGQVIRGTLKSMGRSPET